MLKSHGIREMKAVPQQGRDEDREPAREGALPGGPARSATDASGWDETQDEVDAESEQSFPASDPPSWSGLTI
jgi:hypothetical protein